MAIDPTQIDLTPEQKRHLAEQTGRPWLDVLSDALKTFRPRRNQPKGQLDEFSLAEALAQDGLLGCIKDAPPDLSTNPKYMEGFGRRAIQQPHAHKRAV